MEVREGYAPLARLVARRAELSRPLVVGITGGVAAGKSTTAAALHELLAPRRVEVVGTDGFLFPNAVLESRGLMHRKGFPESYDADAVHRFLDAVRRSDGPARVPVYSHVTYDVVDDGGRQLGDMDVLVLEGVNALQFSDRLDLSVYLHASEASMEEWYVARFLGLIDTAPAGSFYAQFVDLDPETRARFASDVWRSVNLVNLREHIRPLLRHADVVVTKDDDHTVGRTDVTCLAP